MSQAGGSGARIPRAAPIGWGAGGRWQQAIVFGAVALLAFALYARTAAPTITWRNGGADSGELVAASYTLGIAHPPGYPLYVLLGKAWSILPLGEIGYRYSLFSALCGAVAAGLVGLLAAELWRTAWRSREPTAAPAGAARGPLLGGLAAGLSLAAAPAFWAQATVAEVYTLHAALLAAALWCAVRWAAGQAPRGGVGYLLLAALLVGLALGNQLTTIFLVPLGLLYAGVHGWRTLGWRAWLAVGAAFAVGLAIYAYLPLRAAQAPPLNWGDPSSPERLLRHVTGADYGGYLGGRPLEQVLLRVPVMARLVVEQFSWLGVLLTLLGAWDLWGRARREAALLLSVAVANGLFALLYNAEGSQVYLLPAYLVAAVFLGLGAAWGWRLARAAVAPRWRGGLAAGALVLALALPASRVLVAYTAIDVSGDYTALEYALTTLESVPAGAALYPSSDEETFPLWYAQEVLGVRPEVPVVNVRLWRLPWYRAHLARRYAGYPFAAPAGVSVEE